MGPSSKRCGFYAFNTLLLTRERPRGSSSRSLWIAPHFCKAHSTSARGQHAKEVPGFTLLAGVGTAQRVHPNKLASHVAVAIDKEGGQVPVGVLFDARVRYDPHELGLGTLAR